MKYSIRNWFARCFWTLITGVMLGSSSFAQVLPAVDTAGGWLYGGTPVMLLPGHPIKAQVLFRGGYDSVLTKYGMARSKPRNDFVTFVPITAGVSDSGYICIGHETIQADPRIGDGGGMSILKVVREGDSLRRVGPIRNVDFSPVGGTISNCAGIKGPDGQIWLAEEAIRTTNLSLNSADTSDRTLAPLGQAPGHGEVFNDIPGQYSGKTIKAFLNCNYMVKVDPVNAVAVRKQYNWGRMQHEGGAVLPDNRTVIITPDEMPAYLIKFVADTPGDFSRGTTYAFQQTDSTSGWAEIPNHSLDSMLRFAQIAARKGCAMFNRLEWAAEHDGKVYFSETGRDLPQSSYQYWHIRGAHLSRHHRARARQLNPAWAALPEAVLEDSICFGSWGYHDYHGRILVYDPVTDDVTVYLEGGPAYNASQPYPAMQLSNPDGLAFLNVEGRSFMLIAEDIVGWDKWRLKPGAIRPYCEFYALEMNIPNPTTEDLVRIAVTPIDAEATGVASTPDGKFVFITSQHPNFTNPFPYNYAVTLALSGWDIALRRAIEEDSIGKLIVYPNPSPGIFELSKRITGRVVDAQGKVIMTLNRAWGVDLRQYPPGIYFLVSDKGGSAKLVLTGN